MKSTFPTHLVLIDSATGQILIDQMFHVPKIVDLNYMSVAAFRRFCRIKYHYRTPEEEELWKKAVAIPLHSFLVRNRVRKSEKKNEKQEENDHFLTRDTAQIDPLFVASADRSADCVNRTHKKLPCYCQVESLGYTKQKCMMLVLEVNELESLGLPPKDADIVIFSVKHYLPVRWIVANPKAYKEKNIPSAERFAQLNLSKSLSLSEASATFLESESWERSVGVPRMQAHMLDFI